MSQDSLFVARARYTETALSRAGVADPALYAAFASVPREKFLGPGPWRVAEPEVGVWRTIDDPRQLYVDALVALDAERGINNGVPSAHALWIHALELKAGERVTHIGAGAGYYTAILAELVGPQGRVEAYEIDPKLAASAAANLADRPNVELHPVSGVDSPIGRADAIYVNAGASAPAASWLDALNVGARLVFPLTDAHGEGGMLKISRAADGSWPARMLGGAAFIGLIGRGDEAESRAVHEAFQRGKAADVRWLRRDGRHSQRDWLRSARWRLTR